MKYLLLAFLLSACAPLTCQTLWVEIYSREGKPRPAGRVVLTCDGKKVIEANGDNVTAGGK